MTRYILFLSLFLYFVGFSSADQEQSLRKEVQFIIPIPVEQFEKDAILTVRIHNPEQIKRMNNNFKCSETYHVKTQTIERTCPEGIKYQETTPEEFKFPVETILVDVEVESKTVKVGDEYILSVSGESVNYGNNTARAGINGIAQGETITIPTARTRDEEGLKWMHTGTY